MTVLVVYESDCLDILSQLKLTKDMTTYMYLNLERTRKQKFFNNPYLFKQVYTYIRLIHLFWPKEASLQFSSPNYDSRCK